MNINLDDFRNAFEVPTITLHGETFSPRPLSVLQVADLMPRFQTAAATNELHAIIAVSKDIFTAAELPVDKLMAIPLADMLTVVTELFPFLFSVDSPNQNRNLMNGTVLKPRRSTNTLPVKKSR